MHNLGPLECEHPKNSPESAHTSKRYHLPFSVETICEGLIRVCFQTLRLGYVVNANVRSLADKASHAHVTAPKLVLENEYFPLLTSRSLHIEYAIAALAAIYRGIFRNPRRISSKLDLEYFRAGQSYIDREIERTKTKPDYRALFEAMSTSLQELSDRNNGTMRRREETTILA